MKALVCGAGVAGLTFAWWLERDGWDVELVEQASAFGLSADPAGSQLDEAAERLRAVAFPPRFVP